MFNRWKEHVRNLDYGSHHSYKFQDDWNSYELYDFDFAVLETVKDKTKLKTVEQKWIDEVDDFEYSYNVSGSTTYKSMSVTSEFVDNIEYWENIESELVEKIIRNVVVFEKVNSFKEIGKDKHDLSKKWYMKNDPKIINNAMLNYFKNILNVKSKDLAWTTFTQYNHLLSNKGTKRGFVPLNGELDGANKRNNLCFAVNCFPNSFIKQQNKDLIVNDDGYALSILLKWIVRVADLDSEINIYIVSKRMERIFNKWMISVKEKEDGKWIQLN